MLWVDPDRTELLDELPKTISGKILRTELRKIAGITQDADDR